MSKLTLIGTQPGPRLESIEITAPGKITAVMVQEFHGNLPSTAAPPLPQGLEALVNTGHSTEVPLDGGWSKIQWEYMAGVDMGGGGGGNEENIDPDELAEVDIALDQVPLTMHPNILKIMKKFNGSMKDGVLTFPIKDPTGSSRRTATDEEGKVFNVNPFYGVTSYFAPRLIFKLQRKQDGDLNELGKINTPPWSQLNIPSIAGRLNSWLKSQVTEEHHGLQTFLTEEWIYSYDGWEKMIYDYAV